MKVLKDDPTQKSSLKRSDFLTDEGCRLWESNPDCQSFQKTLIDLLETDHFSQKPKDIEIKAVGAKVGFRVSIIRGRNIVTEDGCPPKKPFCLISYGDSVSFETEKDIETSSPEWNEHVPL